MAKQGDRKRRIEKRMRVCFEEDKWLRQALLELASVTGCQVPLSSLLRASFYNFRAHYGEILKEARKCRAWAPLERPSCNDEEKLRAFEESLANVLIKGMQNTDDREGVA